MTTATIKPTTKKRKKKPVPIAEQIAAAEAQLLTISRNEQSAKNTMNEYQKELDAAESRVAECVVQHMSSGDDEFLSAVSDARINRDVVMRKYTEAQNDLKFIPEATKKLRAKISNLRADQKRIRLDHINAQGGILEELIDNAQDSLLQLIAYTSLRSDDALSPANLIPTVRYLESGELGIRFKEKIGPAVAEMAKRLKLDEVA